MEHAIPKTVQDEYKSCEELTELLESLETKPVLDLQDLYNQFEGKEITTRNKPFLIKKLSAAIRERLDHIADQEADETVKPESCAAPTVPAPVTNPRPQKRMMGSVPDPVPQPGAETI